VIAMIPTTGNATSIHRVPRGGRSIVLGVALMLAAQSLHNWRGEPAAEQPPAQQAAAHEAPPDTATPPAPPPREHKPN